MGDKERIRVRELNNMMGAIADPTPSTVRGGSRHYLRMARHNENGQRVAEFSGTSPGPRLVPRLASHPDHAIAVQQMKGFGGVVVLRSPPTWRAPRLIDAPTLPYMGQPGRRGGIVGSRPSCLTLPWTGGRAAIGITGQLVRYAGDRGRRRHHRRPRPGAR